MDAMAKGPRWWQGATLYQIYVRSWRDTDADGYGDLPGVIAGLDYLAWLGVDAIWLSPTMPSPDEDWGYDVSDYLGVHPDLGTLADMDKLIVEAGQRGISVVLDLVPNHTSSAHAWFVEARSGPGSAHRDYYVWADPVKREGKAGGGPPNNWVDATGAPAWTLDAASGQYYLHNFLPSQPDLNWWEPRVHEEFREILRFWFDRGVAGFRIDVAHGLYHDAQLRDNPPLERESRLEGRFGQKPVYSSNRPETHGVYRDWRRLADGYSPPRLLLGESWVATLSALASYYGQDDELELAFNFPFLFVGFEGDAISGVVGETLARLQAGACPVWTASNHDVSRFPTRWCDGDERKARLALLVLATLPGSLMLYYGDEIAMTDVPVPPPLRRDKMTAGQRESRDEARTPMQWDASPSAGFTAEGVTPWLPFGDNASRNVAAQRENPASTLRLVRDLIALRRTAFGGQVATYERLPAPPGVWSYRSGPLLVTANFTGQPVTVDRSPGKTVLATSPDIRGGDAGLVLGPWQGLISTQGEAPAGDHSGS
jgi:alpha-glucosidase